MPGSSLSSTSPIERWSLANAVGMLVVSVVAVAMQSLWPLLLGGGGLLVGLGVVARGRWTPRGQFGLANGVTVLRTGLLGVVPVAAQAGPVAVIGTSVLFLIGDGVDGWLARRREETSEFGAFLDKEADALFVLVLCAAAAFRGRLPLWILGAGLLRYLFVVVLFFVDPPEKTEDRFNEARYVYGGVVGALLFSFLPYPAFYRPVVGLAVAALVASFGRSLWRIVRRRRAFGGAE